MTRRPRPVLPTRVGRATHAGNVFFGHRVEDELLGHETTTSLAILAVTGQRATRVQVDVLDDVATVLSAADPRIWLFKVARLASAYGGLVSGVVCANLCVHRAPVGHLATGRAAALLDELAREVGHPARQDAIAAALSARLAAGRLAGFGVAFRAEDERAIALARRLEESGRDQLPYLSLLRAIIPEVRARRGLEPNATSYIAASMLDLGFAPEHVGPLVFAIAQHEFVANAVEGARQAPPILQRLPDEHVAYVGPAPRVSPRAPR
jgi:hypothetical protein